MQKNSNSLSKRHWFWIVGFFMILLIYNILSTNTIERINKINGLLYAKLTAEYTKNID